MQYNLSEVLTQMEIYLRKLKPRKFMQKFGLLVPYIRNFKKFLLIMKLCTLILVISLTTASGKTSYSQSVKFTLNLERVTVKELFDKIEKSSEFIFVYYDNIIDLNKEISVKANNETVEEILGKVFKSTENTFKVFDRQIVIARKESSMADLEIVIAQQPQKKEISGTVRDITGLSLPGVTIVVKGTTIGTISDTDGNFRLSVRLDAKTIVFSFVGMKSQEFPIAGKTTFNVVMEDEAVALANVVVVGYGTRKKESIVGAISQVDNKALIQTGSSNITNAIAGKLVGVTTIQQRGMPGSNDSEIIIRGLSSWNGSAPLTLVDGVERDFTGLDPNEISSISVLKDASATAVFGAKGANGVLIVTTKRGSIGKPKMEFSSSYGIMASATPVPKHVDSYTVVSARNTALMNAQMFSSLVSQNDLKEYRNPSTQLNTIRYPDFDYFDLLVKPYAPFNSNNFNISGGTNLFKYFCSLGSTYDGSYFRGVEFEGYKTEVRNKRYNYRVNVDFNLTKKTTLSFNLGGDIQKRTGNALDTQGNWAALGNAQPAKEVAKYPAWVLELVPDLDYPGAKGERIMWGTGYQANPIGLFQRKQFSESIGTKLYSDIILNQELSAITKGLSAKAKVSYNTYYRNSLTSIAVDEPQYRLDFTKIGTGQNPWTQNGATDVPYVAPPPYVDFSINGLQAGYYKNMYYELSLNYEQSFGKHNVTGLALVNRQQQDIGTDFPFYNEAFVSRATYDYARKYLVEINLGYTGSERFGPGNRFGFFPSGAIGWVISEEKFFKNAVPWMNKLKFRYSDGMVGSDYASSRWLFTSDYFVGTGNYIYEDKSANILSQWEEARKRDLGIEIGVFNNLFTLSVDLYDEFRDKMLLSTKSVNFIVGNDFKELNKGSVKKHGAEVEVAFRKTINKDFTYNLSSSFSFDENRVVFKDDLPFAPDYAKAAGKPLGYQIQNELANTGYFTSMDDRHIYPTSGAWNNVYLGSHMVLDYNADGKIDGTDMPPVKGLAYPPITVSFSGGLSWKRFDFSFLFSGNIMKYIDYGGPFGMQEFQQNNWYLFTPQLNYWTPTNQDSPSHEALYRNGGGNGAVNGLTWRPADFVRLKDLYLGYTFAPGAMQKMLGISNLLIYVTGTNLLTFTPLIEGDPESKSYMVSGQTYGQVLYPQMRTGRIGLKLSF